GKTNITLTFEYLMAGEGNNDYGEIFYFDGTTWSSLGKPATVNCAHFLFGCGNEGACGTSLFLGQGVWASHSIVLPASANNNANVKIGFLWVNNGNNVGTDPSFAIDNVILSTTVTSTPPVANFSISAASVCEGNCVSYTDMSTNTPTSWAWSFPGATPTSSTLQNPTNICYNTAGVYNASLTATNASGSNTTVKTFTVLAKPTISVSSNTVACSGGTVTLTASGGTSYSWLPATGLNTTSGASVNATPSATTSYTVLGIGSNGCVNTAVVTVSVSSINVVISGNQNICPGSQTTLTASGGSTYTWSPNQDISSTTGAVVTFSPASTTVYSLSASNGSGCSSSTTLTITVANPSVSLIGNPVTCQGIGVSLSGAGAGSYDWTSATSSTIGSPVTLSPTTTTTYTLTGTNSGGCSASTVFTLTVNPSPTITLPSTAIVCQGSSTILSASGANTYSWAPSTGLNTTSGASVTASPTANTTYTVVGTSAFSCTAEATVAVTIDNFSVTISGLTQICPGGNTTLTASGAASYTWSPNTNISSTTGAVITFSPSSSTVYSVTALSSNSCAVTSTVAITVSSPTVSVLGNTSVCIGSSSTLSGSGASQYIWATPSGTTSGATLTISPTSGSTYTLVGINAGGCLDMLQFPISALPTPTITASTDTTICEGKTVSLSAFGASSYQWSTGANTTTISVTPTTTTTYTVGGQNASICEGIETVVVTVNPAPTASAGPNTTVLTGGSTILNGSGGGTYLWSPSVSLSCTNCQNPTATPLVTTVYTVTVTDVSGCSSISTVTVTIEIDCNKKELFMPNAFSPNKDKQNDTYEIKGYECFSEFIFIIYNRWGEKVFETITGKEKWDGTYQEKELDTQAFAYKFIGTTKAGEKVEKTGTLSLIK
ncbi:MAG: gliding motility-associated C-terminal domain-containing protein, partial [Bacteroidetes bacterium]|nr:gliding motility-associated C-terminal domain-containing protein [Bacteroidota bacterium]